jgi:hypothetical protein
MNIFSLLPFLFWAFFDVNASSTTTVSTVYQFESGTWVENIAVRSNGNLVVVLYDRPEIHEINPFVSPPTAQLIARFDGKSGVQGIVETKPDVFAVMPFQGSSYSLWTVDLTADPAKTEVIPEISDVGMLNGLTKLSDTILLASDTKNGAIVRLDVSKKSSLTVIQDDTTTGIPLIGAGINGIRARKSTVYYTNFFKGLLCRVPVNSVTGIATGPEQIISSKLGILDDLAIGANDGQPSYVMQYLAGSIARVTDDGNVDPVAKGLEYPTSAQFGRTKGDGNVLYVSSSGNPLGPTLKGVFEGGKVYAVNLS